MKALSTRNDEPKRASRPFDAGRDGFVVGEGAGILVLESLDHAQRRGAKILAELVGYGMTGDANHITQPAEDGDGAFRVMRAALRDAKVRAAAGRLRQCARHLDPAGRRHRDRGHEARLRRARAQDGRQLHQVHDRPFARRRRRPGSRHQRPGAAATRSCRRPSTTNSPIRPAISTTFRIRRARPKSSTRCRIRSALAAPMPPWFSSAGAMAPPKADEDAPRPQV